MAITYNSGAKTLTVTGYKETFSITGSDTVSATNKGIKIDFATSTTVDVNHLVGRPFKVISGTGVGGIGIISYAIGQEQLFPPFGPSFAGSINVEGTFATPPDTTSVIHLGYSPNDIQADAVTNSWTFCSTEGDLYMDDVNLIMGDGSTATLFGSRKNITFNIDTIADYETIFKLTDYCEIFLGSSYAPVTVMNVSTPGAVSKIHYALFKNADGVVSNFDNTTLYLKNASFAARNAFTFNNQLLDNIVLECNVYADNCSFYGRLNTYHNNINITNSKLTQELNLQNTLATFENNTQIEAYTGITTVGEAVVTEVKEFNFSVGDDALSSYKLVNVTINAGTNIVLTFTNCTYNAYLLDTLYTNLNDVHAAFLAAGNLGLQVVNLSGGNGGGAITLIERKEQIYNILDSVSEANLEDVRVALFDNTGTAAINELSTSVGLVEPTTPVQISNFYDTNSLLTYTNPNPFVQNIRKYNYNYLTETKTLTDKNNYNIRLVSNDYITESTEATVAAYTGITINDATETITLTSNHSIQELYDYCQWHGTQSSTIQYDEFLKTSNGEDFNLTYDLVLNGGDLTGDAYIDMSTKTFTQTSGSSSVSIKDSTGTYTSLNLTGLPDNTEVRVYKTSDDSVVGGIEDTSGGTFSLPYVHSADIGVYVVLHNLQYQHAQIEGLSLTASGVTIPVSLVKDRNYSNP